jgi:hypothetical protein
MCKINKKTEKEKGYGSATIISRLSIISVILLFWEKFWSKFLLIFFEKIESTHIEKLPKSISPLQLLNHLCIDKQNIKKAGEEKKARRVVGIYFGIWWIRRQQRTLVVRRIIHCCKNWNENFSVIFLRCVHEREREKEEEDEFNLLSGVIREWMPFL